MSLSSQNIDAGHFLLPEENDCPSPLLHEYLPTSREHVICFLRKYLDMAFTSLDVLSRNLAMLSGCPGSHALLLQLGSQGWHLFVCFCIKLVCFLLRFRLGRSTGRPQQVDRNHFTRFLFLSKWQVSTTSRLYQLRQDGQTYMWGSFCLQLGVGFFLLYEFIHAYVLCSEIAHVVSESTWIQHSIPIKPMHILLDNVPR